MPKSEAAAFQRPHERPGVKNTPAETYQSLGIIRTYHSKISQIYTEKTGHTRGTQFETTNRQTLPPPTRVERFTGHGIHLKIFGFVQCEAPVR